ncbi:MAG: hypothetical protein HYY20_12940 [Candidatus Tectomicrobia bacterium]|uniref:Uncharacterized protein n=1 Tax=Tectimicrobiota bacterium TaxID=2528274 RepID=A0A932CQU7_UNCTE|nr:hypothetical protein [Candidatus Tectomicrobia bacterium]
MKKILSILLLVCTMAIMATTPASAASSRDPGIQRRIARQQQRIDQGRASGRLTQREATVLQRRLDRVRQHEARMKSTRGLNFRERRTLHQMLDATNTMIYDSARNRARGF